MTEMELTDYHKSLLLYARSVYAIYKGVESGPNVVALRGIDLEMKHGEFISIVGPSGSGKSSLLRILGGLQHPSAGIVAYEGTDITKLNEFQLVPFRRKTVGYVFQEGNLLPSLSAFQNVVQTLRFAGVPRGQAKKRATELLDYLGVKHRMHDLPRRLSGGERQRVAIARALATQPKIILADEPTGNLDATNSDVVMELFRELHKNLNTSFLIVTHSKHVASYSDRSIELRDGRFTGQHTGEFDLQNLQETRQIIISKDGTLVLPPEYLSLLETYGDLWNLQLDLKNGTPQIIATPSQSLSMPTQDTDKPKTCPVCGATVPSMSSSCPSCGAKIRT